VRVGVCGCVDAQVKARGSSHGGHPVYNVCRGEGVCFDIQHKGKVYYTGSSGDWLCPRC
jgi:hypothetical protein